MASLDMLILGLVDAGVNTPYTWQVQAGLSLGATLPAVRRLLAQNLVSEAAAGPRGRREFTITRNGRSELRKIDQYLDAAVLEPIGDLESVLRLFYLAVQSGRRDIALRLLRDAAAEYDRRAKNAQSRASSCLQGTGPAVLYLSCLAQCEADRLRAQAASLRSLLSQFGAVKPARVSRRRKATKAQG